jgi:hypothetical protein
MRNLSTDVVFAQETSEVFVHLLTVEIVKDDLSTQILRYCDQYVPVTSNGYVFEPASFKIQLGRDDGETTPSVRLELDSGDMQVIRLLRANKRSPKINLQVVLASTPDVVEIGPIEYEVESFDFNSSAISLRLTVEPVLNEPIPSLKFTPTTAPGLWANIPA